MFIRRGIAAAALIAGAFSVCAPAQNTERGLFSGGVSGVVSNSSGAPQLGATVILLDQFNQVVGRKLTDNLGSFLFASVRPGSYSLRVTLASFLPALKRDILVQPGMRSMLSVNLAGALSTIELVYSAPGSAPVMSEEWKWTLRSSSATRPVLRLRELAELPRPAPHGPSWSSAFSDTRAMWNVSAGDEGRVSPYGNEPDLGTAFALATSLFGDNQLQVAGNFGYSSTVGVPTAGFRTSYSRGSRGGHSPEVNVTMRQLSLPVRAGAGLVTGQEGAAPPLRTMSVGFFDRKNLEFGIQIEYGFSLESVSFLNSMNYFSPFGRLTYELEDGESLEFAFSSGIPPAELFPASRDGGNPMQSSLAALSLFPRVSLRNGQAKVQRTGNLELAYRRTVGSRTFSLAAFQESTKNAALTMQAPAGSVPPGELLPDLLSNSTVFNAGDFVSAGYMASVTQSVLDSLNFTLAGGSGNALLPAAENLPGDHHPEAIRRMLRRGQRHWLAVVVASRVPRTGTWYTTSYRWSDGKSLTPGHMYLTQTVRPDVGWNVYVRQPVPEFPGMRGRLEATVDLRNLLAQGYLSLATPDGRRVLLLHTPRSLRGGFSFAF